MKFLDFKGALLKIVFCFSLVILITDESFAQGGMFSKKNKINQYSSISIGGGSSHYFGDLAPYTTFYYSLYTNVRWNATINYSRQFTPQFAARVSFTWARLMGDDYTYGQRNPDRLYGYYLRNLHFRNDVKEFALTGVFNLLPQTGKGQQGRRGFMPYALLGIGFYGHSPKARDVASVDPTTGEVTLGGWLNLKELQTSGQGVIPEQPKSYSLLQPVFPVGLGIKLKLTEKLDLNLEGGLRITPFDYLDDVGYSKYPNPTVLAATSPTGALLSYRAGENISARTGEDRTPIFVDIMNNRYNLAGANVQPSTTADQILGYSQNSDRGTSRWDSYFVTQITISYIIGSSVKCPPIK